MANKIPFFGFKATLRTLVLLGFGGVATTITGTGSFTAPAAAWVGTGAIPTVQDAGDVPIPERHRVPVVVGSGTFRAPRPRLSGRGLVTRFAAGTFAAPGSQVIGAGAVTIPGRGVSVGRVPVLSARGRVTRITHIVRPARPAVPAIARWDSPVGHLDGVGVVLAPPDVTDAWWTPKRLPDRSAEDDLLVALLCAGDV